MTCEKKHYNRIHLKSSKRNLYINVFRLLKQQPVMEHTIVPVKLKLVSLLFKKVRGREGGAYSRGALICYFGRGWTLIRGMAFIRAWALIRGNTVSEPDRSPFNLCVAGRDHY